MQKLKHLTIDSCTEDWSTQKSSISFLFDDCKFDDCKKQTYPNLRSLKLYQTIIKVNDLGVSLSLCDIMMLFPHLEILACSNALIRKPECFPKHTKLQILELTQRFFVKHQSVSHLLEKLPSLHDFSMINGGAGHRGSRSFYGQAHFLDLLENKNMRNFSIKNGWGYSIYLSPEEVKMVFENFPSLENFVFTLQSPREDFNQIPQNMVSELERRYGGKFTNRLGECTTSSDYTWKKRPNKD